MEIEVKYTISDDQVFANLKSLSAVGKFSVSPGHLVTFCDTYYDTASSHLLAAGYALRFRQYDGQVVLSLKSLTPSVDNIHKREETEIQASELSIDHPSIWPDTALRDRVWRITGGDNLIPLFVLYQQRFLRYVETQNQRIAEMSLDRMHCYKGDSTINYMGLEVELTDSGTEDNLKKIIKKLEQAFELIPEKRSKYEVAMAFSQVPPELQSNVHLDEVPLPEISWHDSMPAAAFKIFRYHFEVMKQNETGTYRGEDTDYLHDMRVAIRRMRTAYTVFQPYINEDVMQPYLKVLKKTGKVLGAVRDLDVFRENFEVYISQSADQNLFSTVISAWNTAYIAARGKLLKYLSSDRYILFKESFDASLTQAVDSCSQNPAVADKLWQTLDEQRQRCLSYAVDMQQLQLIPMHQYHQLRIYMKHFRYSIEYFRNILGEAGEQTIKETKVVQNHLGALQDAIVAQKYVRTVLQWGSWHAPEQPHTLIPTLQRKSKDVEQYLTSIENSIDQLVDTFPEVWKHFTDFLSNQHLHSGKRFR